MSNVLTINLGTKGDLELRFQVRSTPLADLWLERMALRDHWPMDQHDRFYNFDNKATEIKRAIDDIIQCCDVINQFESVVTRPFELSQDYLNYLHHIFEVYHGLLDQQHSDFWTQAPKPVRQALARLNIAVHRVESVQRRQGPRFVCTWFGMPKTKKLDLECQAQYGESYCSFGTVYLNYCEIGKTLEDLVNDNDKYIGQDAFKPFGYYSADFNVKFFDWDLTDTFRSIQYYIDQHRDFFLARGISSVYNTAAKPLRFPVADLMFDGNRSQLLKSITQRQWIYSVRIK